VASPEERFDEAEVIIAASSAPPRWRAAEVSWSGIGSGFLVGIGAMMLLGAFGTAIGLGAAGIAPGFGTAAWMVGSVSLALFLAGMVAARLGVAVEPRMAALHGALVWALAALAIMGLGPSRLMPWSWPAAGGPNGEAATPAVTIPGLSTGDVDTMILALRDPGTADRMAALTRRPRPDVEAALARIRQRVETNRSDPVQAAAEATRGLQELDAPIMPPAPAEARQRARWLPFGILLLSLAAAVIGGVAGIRRPTPL
jgi:hypothetical protein